jgi:hypothetical protein
MAKRTSKERSRRKKQMLKPWEPLVKANVFLGGDTDHEKRMRQMDEDLSNESTTTFVNNRYTVTRETVPKEQHGLGEHELVWLSIKANDDSARHDWREFQWIKNELAGENWEAIEIYPSEDRLIDSANQFHLWCIPPETGLLPVGWNGRFVMEENSTSFGSQRVWENNMRPTDLTTEEEFKEKLEKQFAE